jgi:uncharacterized protein YdcH (DUF465 family)
MATDEHARHQLFTRLEEVLGPAEAATLMDHLPPLGWGDIATKRDLETLEERIDARFKAIDARFESIDDRFEALDHRFEGLEARLSARISGVDARIDQTRAETALLIAGQTRTLVFGMLASNATLVALAFAAARLA